MPGREKSFTMKIVELFCIYATLPGPCQYEMGERPEEVGLAIALWNDSDIRDMRGVVGRCKADEIENISFVWKVNEIMV